MVDWLVQVKDSGSPASPPEEMMTCAPSDLAVVISAPIVGSLPIGRVSPQMSEQPSPVAKAAV
jgi:hypothetical protein